MKKAHQDSVLLQPGILHSSSNQSLVYSNANQIKAILRKP